MGEVPTNEELWRGLLTGEGSSINRLRRRNRRFPGQPRCKSCLVPLSGPIARVLRMFSDVAPSGMNPRFCNMCETFVRSHPGGAETRLAEQLYLPALGPDHPRKATLAARDLLLATSHADVDGPWVPVGAGVHTGTAYVGAVGSQEVSDFTALGDAVNVTARLSSVAAAGEVLISETTYAAAREDLGELEVRELEVKGRDAPIGVRVLRVSPGGAGEVAERSEAVSL